MRTTPDDRDRMNSKRQGTNVFQQTLLSSYCFSRAGGSSEVVSSPSGVVAESVVSDDESYDEVHTGESDSLEGLSRYAVREGVCIEKMLASNSVRSSALLMTMLTQTCKTWEDIYPLIT